MERSRDRLRITNYKLSYSTKPTKVVLLTLKSTVKKEPILTTDEINLLKFEQKLKQQLTQFRNSRKQN